MSNTSEVLKKEALKIDNVLSTMSGVLNSVVAEIKLVPLDEQAALVVRVKQLKELMGGFAKQVNSVLSTAEETLCRTIAADVLLDMPYKHELGSITPTARGFYSIKDVDAFAIWLSDKHPEADVHQTIHDIAKSKRSCNEFFDNILKGGEALPKCVGKHIIPKVTIRNMEQLFDLGDF